MTPVSNAGVGSVAVLQAEIRSDVLLQSLFRALESSAGIDEGRHFLMLNASGQLLADTKIENQDRLFEIIGSAVPDPYLTPSLRTYIVDNLRQASGVNVEHYLLSISSLNLSQVEDGPWYVVLIDDTDIAFQGVNQQAVLVLGASLLAALGLGLIVYYGLRFVLQPYEQAATLAEQWRNTDLTSAAPMDNGLAQSITEMAGRIQSMSGEFEQHRQRTHDDLDIAARVSEASLQYDTIDDLFERVLVLICSEARFHYAQIFLMDELGENAFLAASHGRSGELVADQRIPVDERSVLGRVMNRGRAEVDNDLQVQALVTPGLVAPRSRSRLVLALLSGQTVFGALDIQSIELNTFPEEELQAFVLLANQISSAIHNIQLLQETREHAQQINTLTSIQTRADWQAANERLEFERAYHYDLREVKTGVAAPSETDTVSMPIMIFAARSSDRWMSPVRKGCRLRRMSS